MNAISYSLFGYNQNFENCLSFKSYIRGLHINIRVAQVLYPGWDVCISIDETTALSAYSEYFKRLHADKKAVVDEYQPAPLCEMMLWRLRPLFQPKYNRVICRDTDSLLSYRERQAVAYWEQGTKMAHAITDSVSHNITLMGGMIGFKSGPFRDRTRATTFNQLMSLSTGHDFSKKGSDQDFLSRVVLPKVADSITEHFVLGHPQTFRGDCHNFIHDIDLNEIGVPEACKDLNGFGYHIGAAGFQTDHVVRWLQHWGKDNAYWAELEKQYSDIFYWWL
jgi:hypothetical protein